MLKYKLLAAAASAAAFAWPAAAQDAKVDAGVEAEVQAEVQAGDPSAATQADVQSDAAGEAGTEAEAEADAQAAAGPQGGGAEPIIAATAADVRAGVAVLDPEGGVVGTVESVDAEGAVVSTGSVRAKMPISSFGKNARGLVISMTRAELEAAAAARTPS